MTSGSFLVTMTTGFLARAMRLLLASLRRGPRGPGRALFSKHERREQRNAASAGAPAAALLLAFSGLCAAASDPSPLPRFASLKADEVYMRAGPGQGYPVEWVFARKGLPVEIVREYEDWRYVRDIDGAEGWIHRVMLSGSRTVIVTGTGVATAYDAPGGEAGAVFRAQPGVQGELIACDGAWCRVEIGDTRGWMPMESLWGVYSEDGLE